VDQESLLAIVVMKTFEKPVYVTHISHVKKPEIEKLLKKTGKLLQLSNP
jgi:hypothetical protein